MNISITSWDMVQDYNDAIEGDCPPGPEYINDVCETDVAEDNLEIQRPQPNKSDICQNLTKTEKDSCN